jgi:DNA replication protein DnaC
LQLNKGDGQYDKRIAELAKTDVLILDDFGLSTLSEEHRRDLLEILDDRHNQRSTIVTSQLPIKHWHDTIGNETLADAILDRLIHNSHRLELKGESMRKTRGIIEKADQNQKVTDKEAVL